jgi:hypothetical protein
MTDDRQSIDPLAGGQRLGSRQIEQLINDAYGGAFRMPAQATFSLATYEPPGPVCAAYIRSMGPIDGIMGPGGSGKTVGSIYKAIRFATNVMPVCTDGTIRCKITVVRDNYRSLYRSTLQSWFEAFPTTLFPDFSGGQDRPGCHRLRIGTVRDGREVAVDIQADFFAIADVNYELLFKSYETSYAWATEADGVPHAAIPFFFSRTGRYPSLNRLPEGTRRPRVLGFDMNPPAPKHPLYLAAKLGSFREDFKPGVDARTVNFFEQPSGLSDQAENRKGKSRADYELEMDTMPRDEARRMVEGKVGRVKDGLPVYDEDFDREKHVGKVALEILPGLPLHMGFDQGGQSGGAGQPACLGFQIAPSGQYRGVLAISCPPGTGVERFCDQLVPILRTRLRGIPPGIWTGDPAGFMGGDKVYGTLSWFGIVQQVLGHRIDPAPTQEWTARLEALGTLMRRDINRETPRLLLCPVHCTALIDALEGDFKFGKRHDGTFDPLPVKNMAANIGEAAQYGCLGVQQLSGVAGAILQGQNGSNVHAFQPREVVQSADWSVY